MNGLFISYRRDESQDIVGRMYDWLINKIPAKSVFLDVDSIPGGSDFRAAIESSVQASGVMLVVIGQKWLDLRDASGQRRLDNTRDPVRMEIEAAIRHGVHIIPILVHGASMPSESALPADVASLSYRNALPVRSGPDFSRDMERVLGTALPHLNAPNPISPQLSPPAASLPYTSSTGAQPIGGYPAYAYSATPPSYAPAKRRSRAGGIAVTIIGALILLLAAINHFVIRVVPYPEVVGGHASTLLAAIGVIVLLLGGVMLVRNRARA